MKDLTLALKDIARVRLETGVKPGRPLQRLVLCPSDGRDQFTCIDVSLKHFSAEDIRELLQMIRAKRPELELPKGWS